ncbi:MAG: hypothetical protein KC503_21220 [Myxococcales bacterium]|nr:hypothetical protein [Myxococcales bacterium]
MSPLSRAIAILAVVGLFFGCSSDDNNNTPTPDVTVIDDLGTPDGTTINYPAGPFGTDKGDVIANMQFFGFKDPNTYCKLEKDLSLDVTQKVPMSFADFHNRVCDGSGKLAKPKQLLWVMVSAGWCGPCIQEIRELGKIIDSGGIDERVAFVDILFENDDHKPATEDFAKKWADTLGLKFPLLLDPTFQMGAYFDRQAVPFNMLVDLDTMQVYFSITGAAFATLGQQVQAFFANK